MLNEVIVQKRILFLCIVWCGFSLGMGLPEQKRAAIDNALKGKIKIAQQDTPNPMQALEGILNLKSAAWSDNDLVAFRTYYGVGKSPLDDYVAAILEFINNNSRALDRQKLVPMLQAWLQNKAIAQIQSDDKKEIEEILDILAKLSRTPQPSPTPSRAPTPQPQPPAKKPGFFAGSVGGATVKPTRSGQPPAASTPAPTHVPMPAPTPAAPTSDSDLMPESRPAYPKPEEFPEIPPAPPVVLSKKDAKKAAKERQALIQAFFDMNEELYLAQNRQANFVIFLNDLLNTQRVPELSDTELQDLEVAKKLTRYIQIIWNVLKLEQKNTQGIDTDALKTALAAWLDDQKIVHIKKAVSGVSADVWFRDLERIAREGLPKPAPTASPAPAPQPPASPQPDVADARAQQAAIDKFFADRSNDYYQTDFDALINVETIPVLDTKNPAILNGLIQYVAHVGALARSKKTVLEYHKKPIDPLSNTLQKWLESEQIKSVRGDLEKKLPKVKDLFAEMDAIVKAGLPKPAPIASPAPQPTVAPQSQRSPEELRAAAKQFARALISLSQRVNVPRA